MANSVATTPPGKPKRGRPKKHIDLAMVEKLAHIQCTYPEIAATLGVSVDTLTRNADFAATYKRGAEGGRKSLRRMQFESANRGNIAMQIWLGKQYLGQSDHRTTEVRQLPSLRDLSMPELSAVLTEFLEARPDVAAGVAAIDAEYEAEDDGEMKPAALLARPLESSSR